MTATLSDLTGPDGFSKLEPMTSIYTAGDISAASAENVSFEVMAPWGIPSGDYTGDITITSDNAGDISIPVVINVNDNLADISRDGLVNLVDMLQFSGQWLQNTPPDTPPLVSDFNSDGIVNLLDFSTFSSGWLWVAGWK